MLGDAKVAMPEPIVSSVCRRLVLRDSFDQVFDANLDAIFLHLHGKAILTDVAFVGPVVVPAVFRGDLALVQSNRAMCGLFEKRYFGPCEELTGKLFFVTRIVAVVVEKIAVAIVSRSNFRSRIRRCYLAYAK